MGSAVRLERAIGLQPNAGSRLALPRQDYIIGIGTGAGMSDTCDTKLKVFLYALYVAICCDWARASDDEEGEASPLRVGMEQFLPLTPAEVVEAARRARKVGIHLYLYSDKGLLFIEEVEPGDLETLGGIQTEFSDREDIDSIGKALHDDMGRAEFFDGIEDLDDLEVTWGVFGGDSDDFVGRVTKWWERVRAKLVEEMNAAPERQSQEQSWQDVSRFLVKLHSRGVEWTSYEDMAKRAECPSTSTIHKAVQRTPVLKEWAKGGKRRAKHLSSQSINNVVRDTAKAKGMDPSDAAAVNTDSLMARLIEAATPEQRAQLNAVEGDQLKAWCHEYEQTGEVTLPNGKIKLVNRRL